MDQVHAIFCASDGARLGHAWPRNKRDASGRLSVVSGASHPRNVEMRVTGGPARRSRIDVGNAARATAGASRAVICTNTGVIVNGSRHHRSHRRAVRPGTPDDCANVHATAPATGKDREVRKALDVETEADALKWLTDELERVRSGASAGLSPRMRFGDYALSLAERKLVAKEIKSARGRERWKYTLEHLIGGTERAGNGEQETASRKR